MIGVPLGVLLGSNEKAYRSVEFLVDFFRSTPSSALIPLFLMIFGVTDMNKIAIAAFAAVLVILFNSAYGVINARKQRVMAARVMGASRWQIFKDVLIWESLQPTFVGLRSGVSMALVIVIVAEMFIGSDSGLGNRIINAQQVLNVRDMYASILAAGALGYVLNILFPLMESASSTGVAGNHVHRHQPRHRAIARPAPFVPGPAGTHITIRGLTKYFAGWPLYEDFNLDIPKGKIVSVFGPNGCGKSTLINMIAGLIPIDAGEILFDGKSLAQTKIGYVFQNYREAMFPWLRTIDNIAYPLRLEDAARPRSTRGSRSWWLRSTSSSISSATLRAVRRTAADRLDHARAGAGTRGAVPGRAVLGAGFRDDAVHPRKLQEVFMQTGTTMLLVSHDLEEAVYLADQVLLLTKRPTRVAEILDYGDARPRTVETLTEPSFIDMKKLSLEIFQREVRR